MSKGRESRRERFQSIDRPALRALPVRAYEIADWRQAKVHRDYHVQVEQTLYSVPYRLIGKSVDVRLGATTLEIFHNGQLVAAHSRARGPGKICTIAAHRAPNHAAVLKCDAAQLMQRAAAIGPATRALMAAQFERRQHPEESSRRCVGILRLAQDFNRERLERACELALRHQIFRHREIRDLILHQSTGDVPVAALPARHSHLRGPTYFQ